MATKAQLLKELESIKAELVGESKKKQTKRQTKSKPKDNSNSESSALKKLKLDQEVLTNAYHGIEDDSHKQLADFAVRKATADILSDLGYEATDSDLDASRCGYRN